MLRSTTHRPRHASDAVAVCAETGATLVGIYDLRRKAGNKHAAALKETLSLVLASPGFLYLAEPSDDATRRPLTGPELAMRLSYFLWGSPPDEALRELGRTGELTKPAVLAAQTDRLLDDPRARHGTPQRDR
jgi:hypothetical protein